ncbi:MULTISPECIES: MarR family winged helix-turn-helix transcriptional regulator [unclassified Sporosarcina]|uniref:MarR family winged helix-turn-helix transcriptional regulator n=1 Tax=unclassified Sporosarcina TaxID=2647733 RepID=UPI0020408E66|nr:MULTISPECIES: MarR family transcriptional regulator [unclassified Sporosarcina]GKV66397.1 MarR family transcriptional regulator [Sporosarcina sp. NCCP-2331]GLB56738.1 MarR family transcriptional regulator [Sporosarcina sp. NCCP-2378]
MNHQSNRLDLMIWFRLSRIYNQSIRLSNQHLKKWGLTAAQFDVLVQVGMHNKISQQELGEKLFVTKGNITQLLQKMERMDLIEREQDWKTKYISLTDEGRMLFREVVPVQEVFQASHFQNLTVEEKKVLNELLKKLKSEEE